MFREYYEETSKVTETQRVLNGTERDFHIELKDLAAEYVIACKESKQYEGLSLMKKMRAVFEDCTKVLSETFGVKVEKISADKLSHLPELGLGAKIGIMESNLTAAVNALNEDEVEGAGKFYSWAVAIFEEFGALAARKFKVVMKYGKQVDFGLIEASDPEAAKNHAKTMWKDGTGEFGEEDLTEEWSAEEVGEQVEKVVKEELPATEGVDAEGNYVPNPPKVMIPGTNWNVVIKGNAVLINGFDFYTAKDEAEAQAVVDKLMQSTGGAEEEVLLTPVEDESDVVKKSLADYNEEDDFDDSDDDNPAKSFESIVKEAITVRIGKGGKKTYRAEYKNKKGKTETSDFDERSDADGWLKAVKKDDAKIKEAKLSVDYFKSIKAGMKKAQDLYKADKADEASEIMDEVSDDAADAAKALKKIKRDNGRSAEEKKQKESEVVEVPEEEVEEEPSEEEKAKNRKDVSKIFKKASKKYHDDNKETETSVEVPEEEVIV